MTPSGFKFLKIDCVFEFDQGFPEVGLGEFQTLNFGRSKIEITLYGRGFRGSIPSVSINVFKGLEAQVVLIPNFSTLSSEKLKYVAMSRAKSNLYIHLNN